MLKFLILILIASACQVGPSYQPPEDTAPSQWKHKQTPSPSETSPCQWWEVFVDPTLNELEEWAVQNNRNLYAALERVAEARALAGLLDRIYIRK